MSFGKDQAHIAGIPVYGGTHAQRAANAGRKAKRNYGTRRPYWADGFRPSETQPSIVRLIPGEYETSQVDDNEQLITEKLPWFPFIEHYSGTHKRGCICSGGPWYFRKDQRDVCEGCNKRDEERYPNRTMSRSEKFGFITIDQGLFHQVPQVDRDSGQVRTNPKTNEAYLEWVKCALRGCQNCQAALQNRYGYIQPWIMPKGHFNALNAYAPGIGTCCSTCCGRGTIQSIAWLCGNPQCQAPIFDMQTTTATDEQIAQVVNEPFGCRACQQLCYPTEMISCTNCTPNGWQPVRAGIFDVDLTVQAPRTGENNTTVLQVVGMTDPKPLDPQFQDLLQYKPDLAKKFAPSSIEEQRSLWKITAQEPQPMIQQPAGYGQQAASLPPTQAPAQAPTQAPIQAPHAQAYGAAPVQQPVVQQPPAVPVAAPPQGGAPAAVPPQGYAPAPQAAPPMAQVPPPQPPQTYAPAPAAVPQAAPLVPIVQPPTVPQGGYLPPQGGQQ